MPRSLLVLRSAFSTCVSTLQGFHIMKTSSSGFKQAYNALAGVGTDSLRIVTKNPSKHPNDKQQHATVSPIGFLL